LIMISSVFSQEVKKYDLDWKLQPNENLTYKTSLSNVDTSQFSSIKFGNGFDSKSNSIMNKSNEFLKQFWDMQKDAELYSVLSLNDKGNIDVIMYQKPNVASGSDKDSLASFFEMVQQLTKGVVLRGILNPKGNIESFYLKQDQKNLLAILFELPTYPVSVGETWSLNLNLLMFDQNFIFKESKRKNIVTLKNVQQIGDDQIAYLDYDIYEYVEGDFNGPFANKSIPTSMEFSIRGTAEFSINKGRWLTFINLTKIESTGFMNSKVIQKDYLEIVDHLPEEIQD